MSELFNSILTRSNAGLRCLMQPAVSKVFKKPLEVLVATTVVVAFAVTRFRSSTSLVGVCPGCRRSWAKALSTTERKWAESISCLGYNLISMLINCYASTSTVSAA